ncbi:MAG TPA: prepilin-type N-terminal cleavage/methylation domain-containing protein [Opitutaceae bacterium]|nr:prepilin-type N-terminal cleavage/methylation domain-containing protein [Opitutaceae bacterium]
MIPVHSRRSLRKRGGFSLVEMIGVLAIIAILAVIIVPKVFATIASSRVTNTVGSINSAKSAISDFAGKYGTVPTTGNNSRIDDLLINTGILDGRFVVKLGNQPQNPPLAGAAWTRNAATGVWTSTGGVSQTGQSRIISVTSSTAVPGTNGANYKLDGTTDLPTGSRVVSAVIVGTTPAEARELSLRIDGDSLTPATAGIADTQGKVAYTAAGTTVYIYLAHQ